MLPKQNREPACNICSSRKPSLFRSCTVQIPSGLLYIPCTYPDTPFMCIISNFLTDNNKPLPVFSMTEIHESSEFFSHSPFQILERAASSPTRITSLCICRIEAGTSGVTGPKKALRTMSALSSPLTTTRIFLACMIVLIPMV